MRRPDRAREILFELRVIRWCAFASTTFLAMWTFIALAT
jgi:hypothetical protein